MFGITAVLSEWMDAISEGEEGFEIDLRQFELELGGQRLRTSGKVRIRLGEV